MKHALPVFRLAALIFFIILVNLTTTTAHAQVTRDWVAQRAGFNAAGVVADANGNIYVTGRSPVDAAHNFRSDIVLIKYDLNGNEIWFLEFDEIDDATNGTDIPYSIALDPANNVIVTGESFINGTGTNFITLKYDPSGNLLWKARYNSSATGSVRVATDAAANVYIIGPSSSVPSGRNYVTVKYNANGIEQWVRTYNGLNNFDDNPHGLAVTAAGEVAVTGESTGGVTSFDIATIVYDTNGNQRWVQRFTSTGVDYGYDVAFGPNNEVYVAGQTPGSNGNSDAVLIKYNANGSQIWARTFNGPADKFDLYSRVRVDSQNNIVATGYFQEANFYTDFNTAKYDPNGNLLWSQSFSGPVAADDYPTFLVIGGDNAIYLTGGSNSSVITIKYDAAGNRQWLELFDNGITGIDRGNGLVLDSNGDVVVAGQSPILTIHYDQTDVACDVSANFSGSPNNLCAPLTVNFSDLSSGPIASWLWNFGDGGASTSQNPSHTYSAGGTYTVSLTVTSATCNDTETKTGYIIILGGPTAAFVGAPTSGSAPLTVNFTDQSINDPNAGALQYAWNFGDGGTSNQQNPSHTYSAPGIYTVMLDVSNNCRSDNETKVNYINVSGGCTNIALGKPASASSSNGSNTPNLAVDGNTSTFWRSSSGGTQYLQVDLGAGSLSYSEATIKWRGTRFAKKFHLRVSNNANFTTFTTVFSTTSGTGGNQTIALSGAPRTERYIRLHMTQVNSSYYAVNEFEVCGSSASAILKQSAAETEATIPTEIALHPNYPNPFNPSTSIKFSLPKETHVTLKIYNLLGEEMTTLVDGIRSAGVHTVNFDAKNLPNGIYFSVLQVGEARQVRRLVLMK